MTNVNKRNHFSIYPLMVLISYTCFLFSSCSSSHDEIFSNDSDCKELFVDLESKECYDIDSVYGIADYIRLETNDSCLIGKISKLLVTDNEIIVVDKKIANGVFVFNRDGSFRTQISRHGRGPREYLDISDVFLSYDGKEICITDFEHERILVYSLSGRYLRTIKNMTWYRGVESLDSCTLIAYDRFDFMRTGGSFLSLDQSNEINYSFGKNIYSSKLTICRYQNLYKFYDGVYGIVDFKNTIYKFTKDSVYACYHITTTPQIIDGEKFRNDIQFQDIESSRGFFNGELVNTERFLMFIISSNRYKDPLFVYDKYYDKVKKIELSLNNPFNILWDFPITCSENNECYHVITASLAMTYKSFIMNKSDNTQLFDKLYSGLSADSNPIICVSKFVCKDEK